MGQQVSVVSERGRWHSRTNRAHDPARLCHHVSVYYKQNIVFFFFMTSPPPKTHLCLLRKSGWKPVWCLCLCLCVCVGASFCVSVLVCAFLGYTGLWLLRSFPCHACGRWPGGCVWWSSSYYHWLWGMWSGQCLLSFISDSLIPFYRERHVRFLVFQILTIPVNAVIAVGTLTSSPKHIVLPPSFPVGSLRCTYVYWVLYVWTDHDYAVMAWKTSSHWSH